MHDWSVRIEEITLCARCGMADTARVRRARCRPVERPAEVIARKVKWPAILKDAQGGRLLRSMFPKSEAEAAVKRLKRTIKPWQPVGTGSRSTSKRPAKKT